MILTVAELKESLNLTPDLGTDDDALLGRLIAAAQSHVERLLGFKIEATFGGDGQEALPADLVQAVSLLAAHWFENREGTLVGVTAQQVPFGVWDIVNEHREWTF